MTLSQSLEALVTAGVTAFFVLVFCAFGIAICFAVGFEMSYTKLRDARGNCRGCGQPIDESKTIHWMFGLGGLIIERHVCDPKVGNDTNLQS